MGKKFWICIWLTSIFFAHVGCGVNNSDFQKADAGDTQGKDDDTDRIVDSEENGTDTGGETDNEAKDTSIQESDDAADTETDVLEDTETETQLEEDTRTEVPEDTESEEETETLIAESQTAHFLVANAGLASNGIGCDLNNDNKIDNNLGGMVNDFITLGVLDGDPTQEIQASITSGEVLIVLKLSDVHSFENDDYVLLEAFGGMIDGFELGDEPPADLFSGYGTVSLSEPASSQFDQSSIADGWIKTPDRPMVVPISIGGQVVDVQLATSRVQAYIGGTPDEDLLGGALESGLICGGVEKKYLIDLLIEKAKLKDPLSQTVAKAAVNGRVDMKCGDKDCISIGVAFSAVSVNIDKD